MHELSIAEGIIRVIGSEAQKNEFRRVLEISLSIGEVSGVVPECIRELFPIAAKGTKAEDAVLKIRMIPVSFSCSGCGYSGPVDREKVCCPVCGSGELRMTGGRELFIESLKVE